jgi:hypothetical protein
VELVHRATSERWHPQTVLTARAITLRKCGEANVPASQIATIDQCFMQSFELSHRDPTQLSWQHIVWSGFFSKRFFLKNSSNMKRPLPPELLEEDIDAMNDLRELAHRATSERWHPQTILTARALTLRKSGEAKSTTAPLESTMPTCSTSLE